MGLGGGGRPVAVALAALALTALTCAIAVGAHAEDRAGVRDCSPQAASACSGAVFGRTFIDHEDDVAFQPESPHFDMPQDGITIWLTDERGTRLEVLSDEDGCYAFVRLEGGSYSITTSPNPTFGLSKLHEEPLHIDLEDGEMREVLLRYERYLGPRRTLYLPIAVK